jgi:RNA polymerase sigma factor (sigma-70 family)
MSSSLDSGAQDGGEVFDRETILRHFDAHQDALVRYLINPLGADLDTAEDIVSALFAKLLDAAAVGNPFVATESPLEYLRTMAANGMGMLRRKTRREAGMPSDRLDSSQRQAPSILIAREKLQKVRDRWNALSEKERTLLTLVDHESLPLTEAAARMSLAYKDASTTYERAHRELEAELGKNWSTFILPASGDTYKPRTREGMLKVIGNLPPEYREILRLSLAEGLDADSAARRLTLSPVVFRERLETGRSHLLKKSGMTMDEILSALRKPLGT